MQKLVQQYIEDIYKTVSVKNISWLFGMTDATTGWCECADCRQLDNDENFDYINVSNRFHKVAVRIMAEIYKKYPSAMLEAWAYHTYRTIPKGVKKIEEFAFKGCAALTTVTLPVGVNKFDNTSFYECKALTTIYVPAKKTDYYKQRLLKISHLIVELQPEKKAKKK